MGVERGVATRRAQMVWPKMGGLNSLDWNGGIDWNGGLE